MTLVRVLVTLLLYAFVVCFAKLPTFVLGAGSLRGSTSGFTAEEMTVMRELNSNCESTHMLANSQEAVGTPTEHVMTRDDCKGGCELVNSIILDPSEKRKELVTYDGELREHYTHGMLQLIKRNNYKIEIPKKVSNSTLVHPNSGYNVRILSDGNATPFVIRTLYASLVRTYEMRGNVVGYTVEDKIDKHVFGCFSSAGGDTPPSNVNGVKSMTRSAGFDRYAYIAHCEQLTCSQTTTLEKRWEYGVVTGNTVSVLVVEAMCGHVTQVHIISNGGIIQCKETTYTLRLDGYAVGVTYVDVIQNENKTGWQVYEPYGNPNGTYAVQKPNSPDSPDYLPDFIKKATIGYSGGDCVFDQIQSYVNGSFYKKVERSDKVYVKAIGYKYTNPVNVPLGYLPTNVQVTAVYNASLVCNSTCEGVTVDKYSASGDDDKYVLLAPIGLITSCDFHVSQGGCAASSVNETSFYCSRLYKGEERVFYKCGGREYNLRLNEMNLKVAPKTYISNVFTDVGEMTELQVATNRLHEFWQGLGIDWDIIAILLAASCTVIISFYSTNIVLLVTVFVLTFKLTGGSFLKLLF